MLKDKLKEEKDELEKNRYKKKEEAVAGRKTKKNKKKKQEDGQVKDEDQQQGGLAQRVSSTVAQPTDHRPGLLSSNVLHVPEKRRPKAPLSPSVLPLALLT